MQQRFYSYYHRQQSSPLYPAPVIYISPMDSFYDRYYEFEPRAHGNVMFMKYDTHKFNSHEVAAANHVTTAQKNLIIDFVQFLDRLRKFMGPDLEGKLWMFKNRFIARYAESEYNSDDAIMEMKAIIVVLGFDNFLQDFF